MKGCVFSFLFAAISIVATAQSPDSIDLTTCIRLAVNKSPVTRQKQLSFEMTGLKIRNLSTNWFPAVSLNGQANYNSETVDFSSLTKGLPVTFPTLPLDQYKAWAEINQQIYDGGITGAQKQIERKSLASDLYTDEVSLNSLKQQVSQYYFAVLLAEKSREQLKLSVDELNDKIKIIQAGVTNGAILQDNLLAMKAEQLKLSQNLDESELTRQNLIKALSVLLDTTLNEDTRLIIPASFSLADEKINRPEYKLFDSKIDVLDASRRLITAGDMPKLFAFSQFAYGRPGYNIVSDQFHTFYTVGIGFKWNFLNYGDSRRQKKVLDLQKDMVNLNRETFDDQLMIQLDAEKTNMLKMDDMLAKDEQIIDLHKEITASYFSKLNNGVITSTDYLTELDAEIMAKLQFELHKIQKLQAIYNYMLLKGDL